MLLALVFLFELFVLFLLSRELTRCISFFLYSVTRSKKATIMILAFLFFPGTLIHEIAHALVAAMTGVPVGRIEFMPVIQENYVKLGSVQIGKTDFFRRFLIGSAPFFVGTTLILGALYLLTKNQLLDNYLIIIFTGYFVFEIGNTMFSSRKDMEGALELFLTLVVLGLIFLFLGIRVPKLNFELFFSQPIIQHTLTKGTFFLLAPIILDFLVIGLLRFIKRPS